MNWMLEYHPPAKCLQILQWDSSAPKQDQDQCSKTGDGVGGMDRVDVRVETNTHKPVIKLKTKK